MNTSPRLALPTETTPEIQSFSYTEAVGIHASYGSGTNAIPIQKESLEQARYAAQKEGEERAHAFFEEQLIGIRNNVRTTLDDFAAERKKYYTQVEAELVKLAMAIAQKILHREIQMDPLVLAGIARVMIDKLEDATQVILRIHPVHVAQWREYFARGKDPGTVPTITEDPSLTPDSCILQTSLGTTELGIDTQLKEIEKGFADLLSHRPR